MLKFRHVVPLALLTLSAPLWAATSSADAKTKETKSHAPSAAAVRDWKAVDANGDHLVSPEEMEKYLQANPGPLKKR